MTTYTIQIPDADHVAEAAARFAELMGSATIFAFRGEMGVGKTTFICELCRRLGVTDDVAGSPSFSIVNVYDTPRGHLYHFDLYRLESAEEALDIGVEDYLYSQDICLIEWPDRIDALLPDDTAQVSIVENPDGSRTLTLAMP
ncbi:MAG: tRNA (adenosine(37)-N6)-threonylcarbamoyltransferase complex ATPase subunit type 1 TsaE [Paramuribaculum sp.]|nr:tRNA (adenosine(37)-N6)-threonylcarbamoyltransferase complex ATPase subunit type 1 TsaE [Paramuribaculum sp.]